MPSRLRRYDEFGHVHFVTMCCFRRLQFFRHDLVKEKFVEAMVWTRHRLSLQWVGYVIMPEHVHFLVFPESMSSPCVSEGAPSRAEGRDGELTPISQVLHDLKGVSGRWCKDALRDVWRGHRSLGTRPLDSWATGTGEKPIWKPRGYDFNILESSKVFEKLNYIHGNPVRRGLVRHPADWPWSSYRFYEGGGEVKLAMDWDASYV